MGTLLGARAPSCLRAQGTGKNQRFDIRFHWLFPVSRPLGHNAIFGITSGSPVIQDLL
jgi:hypothetical protein